MNEDKLKKNEDKLKKNIRDLYLKFLGREPDNAGLQYFLNNIKENIMTINDVEKAIQNSEEFLSNNKKHLQYAPNFESLFTDSEIQKMLNSSES